MNFSDRFLGIVAETKPPGNDPHKVAEAIRHNGLIQEELLPFNENLLSTVEEYFSFKGADEQKCRKEGLKFLDDFEILHEWVWQGNISKEERIAKMKECLRY